MSYETTACDAPLISVIIPTYNRFSQLCVAINSVRSQTFKNIEIIVVNDASTQREYYENIIDATIIHLRENSRAIFGYPCAGYVRNQGAKIARGEFLAFLDDDDEWLPDKLEIQYNEMMKNNMKMCCTEAYFCDGGSGGSAAPLYNAHYYIEQISEIFLQNGSNIVNIMDGFPDIWTRKMLKIHNCIITSSVVLSRDIFMQYGGFNFLRNGEEDYNLWLDVLENTNCLYIKTPCLKYNYSVIEGKHN